MPLYLLAAWFVAGALLVIGVSHLVWAGRWAGMFGEAAQRPWGGFVVGLPFLCAGLFVALVHTLWVPSLRVLVTVVGWMWLAMGSFFVLVPPGYSRVAGAIGKRPVFQRLGGAVMTIIAVLILVSLLRVRLEGAGS